MANKWISLSTEERDLLEMALSYQDNALARKLMTKITKAGSRITISSAKGKGRALQMSIASKLSTLLDVPFDQQDDQCDIHSREMGLAGQDLILRGKAFKRFPVSVECKSQENLNMTDAVAQVKTNLGKAKTWILVHRKKSIPDTLVTMSWETMEMFYRGEISDDV